MLEGGQSVITAAETGLIPPRDDLDKIEFAEIVGKSGSAPDEATDAAAMREGSSLEEPAGESVNP